MSKSENLEIKQEKDILRVALDSEATRAFKSMEQRLTSENQHVSFHPSAFVSYLVKDFYQTYFDRDVGILVAEFFDSKSYYEEQVRQARANGNFEEVMAQAIAAIKRIKNRKRGKQGRKRKASKQLNVSDHETV